jgi:glycosyltransferase involved in cell wall biosynthesis
MDARTPVLHLIQRFYVGGAERQFIERLRAHPPGFAPVVGCLELSGGNLDDFRTLGLEDPVVFPTRGSLLRPNTLAQVRRIAATIRERGIRIVHGTDFVTNFLGLLGGRLGGARVVVSRVDLGHPRPGFGWLRRRMEKLVSAAADAVCANAEAVRQLCIDDEGCSPERVAVVRNGIELSRFDRRAAGPLAGPVPDARPLVAVVANLWPVKGHRVLLESIARVRRRFPDAVFALVGDGPERPALERRAAELGIGSAVAFLGTRYDVPAILARADAACLPSFAEGLPNAVMEAMAARLPVVATSVGGAPELVEHGVGGYLVPPGDPDALAAALIALLRDPAGARAMGARGRARAASALSLASMQRGYLDLYRQLLANDRRAALSATPQRAPASASILE